MTHDPDNHRRRSIRLHGYDYAQAGAYFVTICTQQRACLFGDVVDGEVQLNEPGNMVERWWLELRRKFPLVKIDEYVVMPNHFHGIVVIVETDECIHVGADLRVCPHPQGAHPGAPLPRIIQWFKTMSTNAYIRGVKELGWAPFQGRLWQRNYYEHIIRKDGELDNIRRYIEGNPVKWLEDTENPKNRPA